MKKMLPLPLGIIFFCLMGCASAGGLATAQPQKQAPKVMSVSEAKAQVLKDSSSVDILQPFGKFAWDDGIYEIMIKLKEMGITTVTVNKAINETIPVDFLVEVEGERKYLGEKVSETGFSAYPVIIDGIPFELQFVMESSPAFAAVHPERTLKTRRGYTISSHLQQLLLNIVSNKNINTESITEKVLKKYRRFIKEGDFTTQGHREGNFTDLYGNFFYIDSDKYAYCGIFYQKALDEAYQKGIADKEKEEFKGLKDMGNEL